MRPGVSGRAHHRLIRGGGIPEGKSAPGFRIRRNGRGRSRDYRRDARELGPGVEGDGAKVGCVPVEWGVADRAGLRVVPAHTLLVTFRSIRTLLGAPRRDVRRAESLRPGHRQGRRQLQEAAERREVGTGHPVRGRHAPLPGAVARVADAEGGARLRDFQGGERARRGGGPG